MDTSVFRRLLQQARFQSLFRELGALDLSNEPELLEQYTSLSARYHRYRNEQHLMHPSDFEVAQNRLIQGLSHFLDELETAQEATSDAEPASSPDAKAALFALIDENQYAEVFAQVRASSYRYDKATLSRLEKHFSFQITPDLVDQLKVFVGSLRS